MMTRILYPLTITIFGSSSTMDNIISDEKKEQILQVQSKNICITAI
jgi:hypothetical protein